MDKKWDSVCYPRAIVYKMDDIRVSRWDHFKTFWNAGKTSIPCDCDSVSFSFGILSLKRALSKPQQVELQQGLVNQPTHLD